MGSLLHKFNRFSEARQSLDEALDIRRGLVEKDKKYLCDAAATLINLGNLDVDEGSFVSANKKFEEALIYYRKLAEKTPKIYLKLVSKALNNLAVSLSKVREYSRAQEFIEEALLIKRRLASENRSKIYFADIALSLNALANICYEIKDFVGARKAYEENIEIYRYLAVENPKVYLSRVADSKSSLSGFLRKVRDFAGATELLEEVLKIRRKLVAENPKVFLPDLAKSLDDWGTLLCNCRKFNEAEKAISEAISIWKNLVIENPTLNMSNLANALSNHGILLYKTRDFIGAYKVTEEALQYCRKLVADNSTACLPMLSTILVNLGVVLGELKNPLEQMHVYEEALNIRRQLTQEKPEVYLSDLASSLSNLGCLYHDQKSLTASQRVFKEALNIRRKLIRIDSQVYATDLAVTLNNFGNLLRDMADYKASQEVYGEALLLRRELFLREPETYRADLVLSLCQVADGFLFQGNSNLARNNYVEVISLIEDEYNETYLHLLKNYGAKSYKFQLAEATGSREFTKAFAITAAMRKSEVLSKTIGYKEQMSTQNYLKQEDKKNGALHYILIASTTSKDKLSLGIVGAKECLFTILDYGNWTALFPLNSAIKDQNKRKLLAREIWLNLPAEYRALLIPEQNKKKFIAISADPFWCAFPWELLNFGESQEDYLGLHYALPRLEGILTGDLENQLSPQLLGVHGGEVAVMAPYDTSLIPLVGVKAEVEALKKVVLARGGKIVAFATNSSASDLEMIRQIELQPDILYFSGHGGIIQNQESLVLHRDMKTEQALSSKSFFSRTDLSCLSEAQGRILFPQSPLIVLNSCVTGRTREAGGEREDFVSALLGQGAGSVIATALPIYDQVGKALGETLFNPHITQSREVGEVVLATRQNLAKGICNDITNIYWGAWGMIHLHGNARGQLPFN